MKSATRLSLFAAVELIVKGVCDLFVDSLLSIFLACGLFFVCMCHGGTSELLKKEQELAGEC